MSVEAILLGIAQDGGLPQAGCACANCSDPALHTRVACLGLVDRAAGRGWLIDATPDFREQLRALGCPLAGIALTHAHVGHYAGLIHLGREAWNTRAMPVHTSARMADFLRNHAPWSQLVSLGNIRLEPLTPGREIALSSHLHLVPYRVPHRDEFSDTLAFLVRGPARRLFYCPDVDAWDADAWEHDLRRFVAGVDVALLDGSFYSADELPGRDVSEILHPLAVDTARRLAGVDCDVRLIHLNHSNPLHRPGPERDQLAAQGVRVSTQGDRWVL